MPGPSRGLGSRLRDPSAHGRGSRPADLPAGRPFREQDAMSIGAPALFPVFPIGDNPYARLGNVDPMPVAYALRPRLRSRLTPGGRTCPGKPWDSGGGDFHPPFRYSCPHNHWRALHRRFRVRLLRCAPRSPTNPIKCSAISARRFTPDHFRRGASRPVSCYALFKWWLPLSQHPGCPRDPTSLAT